jgi:hypothetical protein
MYLKYDNYDCDYCVRFIPDTEKWELSFRYSYTIGDNFYEDPVLLLEAGGEEIVIDYADAEFWAERNLSYVVGDYFRDIVDAVGRIIDDDPRTDCLDICKIKEDLFQSKYKDEWLKNGYIKMSPDGSW